MKYPSIKRTDKKNCKLTDSEIKEIRIAFKNGDSIRSLSRKFNVARVTIKYWIDENYREKDKRRVMSRISKMRENPEKKILMNKQRADEIYDARHRIIGLGDYHKAELIILNKNNKLSREKKKKVEK